MRTATILKRRRMKGKKDKMTTMMKRAVMRKGRTRRSVQNSWLLR
jgi:hypothetical protein